METAILYVKRGCPYCKAATNYLDQQGIRYQEVEVRGAPEAMKKLEEISGQRKTPTLVWNGDVLANFGTQELGDFLATHQPK
ncbi:MAG TPA: glutaredoxin family protein [Chthoniobacterales bacterium]|jgi:glutaredoxin